MNSITDFSKIKDPEILSALLIFSTCNHSDFLLFETESAEEYSSFTDQSFSCPEKAFGLNCAFPLIDEISEGPLKTEEVYSEREQIMIC